VLVAGVVTAGVVVAPWAGILAAVPAAATIAAALVAVVARGAPVARLTTSAGVVSASTTAVVLAGGSRLGEGGGTLGLLECAALAVLLFHTVRGERGAAVLVAAVSGTAASALCILRVFPPSGVLETVGACATWSLGAVVALTLGGYLRSLERRRIASIAAARQAQRLSLSRDLHDYVAHDVSGIVAQAQSARFVNDPAAASEALARIEAAGLRALAAMDRTMESLAADDPAASGRPGAAALPELIDRFRADGPIDARLELDDPVPAAAGETVYRVVSEALTNVRRHAVGATRVTVTVDRPGGETRVTITDDGAGGGATRPAGGTGVAALRDRIAALGGTLTAGPIGHDRGWRVRATLPAQLPR